MQKVNIVSFIHSRLEMTAQSKYLLFDYIKVPI